MTTNNLEDTSNPELVAAKDEINKIIESFIELGVLVHDFQGTEQSRDGLSIKLNQTIESLEKLSRPAKRLSDISIPLDVLEYIEDGRNPDVYTREFVESIRRTNQYLNGKMIAMKQLRDCLGEKMVSEFPELGAHVEDIIKRTDG